MDKKTVNEKWHEEIEELIREKQTENEILKKVRDSIISPNSFPEKNESIKENDHSNIQHSKTPGS